MTDTRPRSKAGRKPIYEKPTVVRAFTLRQDQSDWIDQQPNKSEAVRRGIDREMKAMKGKK